VNDIPVKKMELKRKTIDVTEDEMEDVDPGGRNVRCRVYTSFGDRWTPSICH
jgi:hypothetical protein